MLSTFSAACNLYPLLDLYTCCCCCCCWWWWWCWWWCPLFALPLLAALLFRPLYDLIAGVVLAGLGWLPSAPPLWCKPTGVCPNPPKPSPLLGAPNMAYLPLWLSTALCTPLFSLCPYCCTRLLRSSRCLPCAFRECLKLVTWLVSSLVRFATMSFWCCWTCEVWYRKN